MELLLLLLLSPSAILCQRYRSAATSSSNPNDEPFLPIYPVYPYSPKLMKRGVEAELTAPLTAELYAPKPDARDSYTAGFSGDYQRDPYYPSYNPYPKTSGGSSFPVAGPGASAVYSPGSFATPSPYGTSSANYGNRNAYTAPTAPTYSPYSTGYSAPYPYTAAPYGIYNSYGSPYAQAPNPYGASPYAAPSYPNYNYQPPYYYPSYYNQPYPAIPPPPHAAQDYGGSAADDSSADDEQHVKSSAKKPEGKKNRYKDDDSDTNGERKAGQFVDGVNYLSSGSKDLDGQSTSYKPPYNQLDQLSDLHLRSLPIPGLSRTTYRVISVGGQPVGPDYPLPSNYAKVQQLEQIMGQTLAKLLAQNQAAQIHNRYRINEPTNDHAAYGGAGFVNKSPPGVIAKTGLAYVVSPANLPKPGNVPGQFVENYGNPGNSVIIKVQDPSHGIQQSSTVLAKAKYADPRYPLKSVTTVSLQQAPGVYIPPEAKDIKDENSQSPEYNDYDTNPSQTYDNTSTYKKNEQNYSIDQTGQTATYQNPNLVTVQTPQTYQYSSYLPTQSSQQQQPRDYKTNLDEVNFPTKRNSKA